MLMSDSTGNSTSHIVQTFQATNTIAPQARISKEITMNGQCYHTVNMIVTYTDSQAHIGLNGGLVDR